jgi:hypothetical protein
MVCGSEWIVVQYKADMHTVETHTYAHAHTHTAVWIIYDFLCGRGHGGGRLCMCPCVRGDSHCDSRAYFLNSEQTHPIMLLP